MTISRGSNSLHRERCAGDVGRGTSHHSPQVHSVSSEQFGWPEEKKRKFEGNVVGSKGLGIEMALGSIWACCSAVFKGQGWGLTQRDDRCCSNSSLLFVDCLSAYM
jgi:hypothetical protein